MDMGSHLLRTLNPTTFCMRFSNKTATGPEAPGDMFCFVRVPLFCRVVRFRVYGLGLWSFSVGFVVCRFVRGRVLEGFPKGL